MDKSMLQYGVVTERGLLIEASPNLEKCFGRSGLLSGNNILKCAEAPLKAVLESILQTPGSASEFIVRHFELPNSSGENHRIGMHVQEMDDRGLAERCFLMVFHDFGPVCRFPVVAEPVMENDERVILQHKIQLVETYRELQRSVRELERANHELRLTNEELRLRNERMQSANADLASSRKEIMSGMAALDHSRKDLENVLNGTRIATIFLNRDRCVNSFTPSACDIYRLGMGDLGKPLEEVPHRAFEMPPLPAADMMNTDSPPVEHEIQTDEGRWFYRRVLPYIRDGKPDGLIVTFVDLSEPKRLAMRLATAHDVTRLLSASDSFEEVIPKILEAVRGNLNASLCALWLADTGSRELFCAGVASVKGSIELSKFVNQTEAMRFRPGDGLPGIVQKTRQPHWIENVAVDSRFRRSKLAEAAGLISGMATPILSGKRFVGVIEFYTSRTLDREQSLLNMLSGIGREIGQFIWQQKLDNKFRDEEARKSAILESALDCIITMDVDGKIVDFNAAAESTFGYSQKEVRGRPLSDVIIPKNYREAHKAGFRRFLETGDSGILKKRLEMEGLRSDGSRFPVELAINASITRDGIPFFTGYLRDITERKQAELAVAERDATIRSLLNATAEGIIGLDLLGKCTFANTACVRMLGFESTAEILGKDIHSCFHHSRAGGQMYPPAECPIQQSLCEDSSIHVDSEVFWRMDGTSFPVEYWRNPIRRNDEVVGSVVTFLDVTQRRLAKTRENREAEIEHFLNEAGFVLASSLDYEETLARVTGLCIPTLADWAFVDLVDPDGTSRRVAVVHARPDDNGIAREIGRFTATSGWKDNPPKGSQSGAEGIVIPEFSIEMFRTAMLDEEHESIMRRIDPKSVIVVPLVARATTFGALTLLYSHSRRRYDLRDLKVAEELARRAAIAIDNARLFEQGQHANRAKSEFVANMSHEIRTPMTAVLGYADLLSAGETDPQKKEYLQTIKRNGQFLLEIINDILDLSKIEAGKMETVQQPFTVQSVVADVQSMMRIRAMEKNLSFEIEFDGALPERIESDSRRLKQILVNLVGNAIKFTETGGVKLVVRYVYENRSGFIQFDVMDTGIGITDEQMSRLFQNFSQGDTSVTRAFGGTGLGLAISRRLARLLGGEITVESQPGKGSRFSCRIAAGEIPDVRHVHPRLQENDNEAFSQGNNIVLSCRVLVVDDRRDVRFLAKHFLQQAGAQVVLAADGMEAIEKINKPEEKGSPFDLVLLDMQMPRMDGYQTATRLRESGYCRPIIALTADAIHGDVNRCLECGCDAWLSKPVDAGRLLKTVEKYTGKSASGVSAISGQFHPHNWNRHHTTARGKDHV